MIFSRTYFIVTGALAFLTLAFPLIVALGLMAFVIPGIILGLMPALFIYSLMLSFVAGLPRGVAAPWRWLAAAAIVAAFAFAVPMALNVPGERLAAALRAGDVNAGVVRPADVIAIVEEGERPTGRDKVHLCSQLCQRLLFNGASRRVIVAALDSDNPDAAQAKAAFALERRTSCPAAPIRENTGQWQGDGVDYRDTPENRIKTRVAAGECLVNVAADIGDARMMLVDRKIKSAQGTNFARPWSLVLDTLSARRIELLTRDGDSWTTLDRKTQTTWEPLIAPLLIGPVGGYGLAMTSGFIRRSKASNRYEYPITDQYRRLFGDAVRIPAVTPGGGAAAPADEIAMLRRTIGAALTNAGTDGRAGFDAFDAYLGALERRGAIEPEDVELLSRAVRDPRVTKFFRMSSVVRAAGASAIPLAHAFMDRLMASPLPKERDSVQSMSSALATLPVEGVVSVARRIDALSREPERRGTAWRIVARMGEAGPPAAARYIEILQETPDPKRKGVHDDADVVLAALMGLCRMGESGRSGADVLFRHLADDMERRKGSAGARALLAVEALTRMGEAGRLTPAFATARDWPRIERRIADVSRPRASACVY